MINLSKLSALSGDEHTMTIDVDPVKLHKWMKLCAANKQPLIQDFFPELSPDEREFILTGITPEEWETLKPDDC